MANLRKLELHVRVRPPVKRNIKLESALQGLSEARIVEKALELYFTSINPDWEKSLRQIEEPHE